MGLFDKKYCDVCGEKIGLLGNRKLEDGNLCKNCAKKLSPWFDDRRHSTLEQIKEQLKYREANKLEVESFNPTRTFGESDFLYIDEEQKKFFVSNSKNYQSENPDVLELSLVTGCDLDIDKRKFEEMRENHEGQQVSYNPPRYRYEYDFNMVIRVNHPWFDEMRMRLNTVSVEILPQTENGGFFDSIMDSLQSRSFEYNNYVNMGQEIKDALLGTR